MTGDDHYWIYWMIQNTDVMVTTVDMADWWWPLLNLLDDTDHKLDGYNSWYGWLVMVILNLLDDTEHKLDGYNSWYRWLVIAIIEYMDDTEHKLDGYNSWYRWLVIAIIESTVYPKKYAHGFVVLCFVVVKQSFIMNSHEVFFHIHQGCFAGTGAIVRLPQCQWSKPDGYGKISQCITTTKHSKSKTVCIFLGIYCIGWYRTQTWWLQQLI